MAVQQTGLGMSGSIPENLVFYPPKSAIYVDTRRDDSYTENGHTTTPFKTLQAAHDSLVSLSAGDLTTELSGYTENEDFRPIMMGPGLASTLTITKSASIKGVSKLSKITTLVINTTGVVILEGFNISSVTITDAAAVIFKDCLIGTFVCTAHAVPLVLMDLTIGSFTQTGGSFTATRCTFTAMQLTGSATDLEGTFEHCVINDTFDTNAGTGEVTLTFIFSRLVAAYTGAAHDTIINVLSDLSGLTIGASDYSLTEAGPVES